MNHPMKLPRLTAAVVALAVMALAPSRAQSQDATLTPYSGFRLGGTVSTRRGDLRLDDAAFYGVQLDVRVRSEATGALLVDYQPTTLRLRSAGQPTEDLFDINVWYFQGGGTLEMHNGGAAVPFALGTLGVSWFDPSGGSQGATSEWGLSGIFGAGAKIPLESGRMALRLQARVLLTSLYGGGSFWCGSGSGCYIGAGGPIGPVQFDFGGGLTFGGF